MIVQYFFLRMCRRGICKVTRRIVNTYFLYQVVYLMWFTQKTILLGVLLAETITYLSCKRDMCSATFGSLKIGIERVPIEPSDFLMIARYDYNLTIMKSQVSQTSH
jgi:hypothetical protein